MQLTASYESPINGLRGQRMGIPASADSSSCAAAAVRSYCAATEVRIRFDMDAVLHTRCWTYGTASHTYTTARERYT